MWGLMSGKTSLNLLSFARPCPHSGSTTLSEVSRVLFVTPEAHPLIKTGGLGDVAGALPAALRETGLDVRVLLPAYPSLIEKTGAEPLGPPLQVLRDILPARLFLGLMPDAATPVYLVDAPSLYHRCGPYVDENGRDWPDNVLRFGLLARVASMFGHEGGAFGWAPQLVHCNDWQTGLTPAYLAHAPGARARSLISIHNMAFQGNFAARLLRQLDLPRSSFSVQGLEFHGKLSFLKAGLYYADHITTVSPTYAREIQTAAFGYGLQGLLSLRRKQLTGILNGVDTVHWNPASDALLPARYSSGRLQGKSANKRSLQERFGLRTESGVPVLGMVTRLTRQKGIDLVLGIAEKLLAEPVQLIILGSGDGACQNELQRLRLDFEGKVGIHIGYDEELAHLVMAGSDIFLMPSRFEPCGLTQMYSMLYGTPPIVRRTGGLADSVVDATPRTLADDTATGFLFTGDNEAELMGCVLRALILYQQKTAWRRLQTRGMKQDFSWRHSAEQYLALYRVLVDQSKL